MKEPYGEGVASHTDPESCVVSREAGHEVLTIRGTCSERIEAGETPGNQDADLVYSWGRQHRWARYREHPLDLRGQRPEYARVRLPRFISGATRLRRAGR
jgi:hypothetical protein